MEKRRGSRKAGRSALHGLTDFMASEIFTGYTGAPMQCPAAAGSGRKTQAVGPYVHWLVQRAIKLLYRLFGTSKRYTTADG
jgi:hypothetical protein